jgi:hypothetical protein
MDDQAKQSLVRPVQNTTPTTLKSEEQTLSEQTVTPTPRTLGGFVVQGKDKSSFSTQVHWTVRLRVTTMSAGPVNKSGLLKRRQQLRTRCLMQRRSTALRP